jgi:tetratricopeptide (TPR) repeat protein
MSFVNEASLPTPRSVAGVRALLGLTTAGALAAALLITGWGWWHGAGGRGDRHHWEAVSRGRSYLRQGRADMALQSVQDVRDDAEGAGEAMTVAGLALLRLGEVKGARLALERAIKLRPNQFEADMALAELNLALGNGQRAIALLEAASVLRPREFQVWLTMARVYNDLGTKDKAIQAYRKAVKLSPGHREALIGLIVSLVLGEQPREAEPWIIEAKRRYPDDPVVLGWAARAAFGSDRLDEALSLADLALARDPKNFSALLARARSLVVRGRWQDALPAARAASDASADDLGALHLLVKIETRLGHDAEAAALLARRNKVQQRVELMNRLTEELARHPDDPEVPWKLGQTAQDAGSALLAARCFEAALALDPNFGPARESLAALRASQPPLKSP